MEVNNCRLFANLELIETLARLFLIKANNYLPLNDVH